MEDTEARAYIGRGYITYERCKQQFQLRKKRNKNKQEMKYRDKE